MGKVSAFLGAGYVVGAALIFALSIIFVFGNRVGDVDAVYGASLLMLLLVAGGAFGLLSGLTAWLIGRWVRRQQPRGIA